MMNRILKQVYENSDKYGFMPYVFDKISHSELEPAVSPLPIYQQYVGSNVLHDDEIFMHLVMKYNKNFEEAMETVKDEMIKLRTNFINEVNEYQEGKKKWWDEMERRLFNSPKIRKNELKKLWQSHEKYHVSDREFERWHTSYLNLMKDERIDKTKPSLMKKIEELINENRELLRPDEFRNELRDYVDYDFNELYELYKKEREKRISSVQEHEDNYVIPNPFRTKSKHDYLVKEGKHPLLKNNNVMTKNYFPKDNKKYFLHIVSAPGLFVIDFLINNEEVYLIAIEVNSRKLYIAPTNVVDGGDKYTIMKKARYTKNFINALNKIITQGAKIKALKGDGEGAFKSAILYYQKLGIEFIPVDRTELVGGKTSPNHNSLSLIDRAIRTLRDMAFNINIPLNPSLLPTLVRIYNDTPHSTLSKIMNFPVTPNMVSNDPELEREIIKRIKQMNYNILHQAGYLINEGVECRVLENYDQLTKKRRKVKPTTYKVISYDGGKYTLRNELGEVIQATRAMIHPLSYV